MVKVLFYTDPELATYWRGRYRCAYVHGLYDKEFDMGVSSVITLKIGLKVDHDTLLQLIAHEIGHHVTWIKDKKFGERKADKIAERLIARYKAKHK